MKRHVITFFAPWLALLGTPANALETITFSYDARGRLVRVAHAGGINDGAVTRYAFDKADNRVRKQATKGGCVAVVPIPTGYGVIACATSA